MTNSHDDPHPTRPRARALPPGWLVAAVALRVVKTYQRTEPPHPGLPNRYPLRCGDAGYMRDLVAEPADRLHALLERRSSAASASARSRWPAASAAASRPRSTP